MSTKKRKSEPKKDVLVPHAEGNTDFQTVLYLNPASPNLQFYQHFLAKPNPFIVDSNFEEVARSIRREAKNGALCKDLIRDEKIEKSLQNTDFILAKTEMSVNSSGEILTKIVGFATGGFLLTERDTKSKKKDKPPKISLYIDILCGHSEYKNVGSSLMADVKQLAKLMELKSVRLDSITESLGFYLGLGLKCDPFCKMKWKI